MNQWVFFGGELKRHTVFKDRMFRKPIQHPVDGEIGYIVVRYKEIGLVYSSEYGVWHLPGLDLEKYRDILKMPREELRYAS